MPTHACFAGPSRYPCLAYSSGLCHIGLEACDFCPVCGPTIHVSSSQLPSVFTAISQSYFVSSPAPSSPRQQTRTLTHLCPSCSRFHGDSVCGVTGSLEYWPSDCAINPETATSTISVKGQPVQWTWVFPRPFLALGTGGEIERELTW